MLWRSRPDIPKFARKHDAKRLIAALHYRDCVTDSLGRVHDLGVGVRRDATLALASVTNADGYDVAAALTGALADRSGDVRRAAVWALGARGESRAASALTVAALTWREPRYGAASAAACDALVKLAGPDAAEQFVVLYMDGEDGDVVRARVILMRMVEAGGAETERTVSDAAVAALPRDERRVSERAANVLVWLGKGSVPPLLRALQQGHARLTVIHALGTLRDTRATGALVTLLRDRDAAIRRAAAEALGQIADPRASQPLLDAMLDPDVGVRQAALSSAEELGPLAIISQVATNDPEQSDRSPPNASAAERTVRARFRALRDQMR